MRALIKKQNYWHGLIGQKIKRNEKRRTIKENRKEFSGQLVVNTERQKKERKQKKWRENGQRDTKKKIDRRAAEI